MDLNAEMYSFSCEGPSRGSPARSTDSSDLSAAPTTSGGEEKGKGECNEAVKLGKHVRFEILKIDKFGPIRIYRFLN